MARAAAAHHWDAPLPASGFRPKPRLSPKMVSLGTTAGSDPAPLQRHPLLGTRHRLQTATNAPPHQATRHSANAASRHIPNKQRHCARSRACPHRISGLTANVALKAATEAAPCPQVMITSLRHRTTSTQLPPASQHIVTGSKTPFSTVRVFFETEH